MDARLRDLERRWRTTGATSDEAAWLATRVQVGALAAERLALASLLGHEAALAAGATPLADPLAGRDEDAFQRVDAFRRTGHVTALRPVLDDPTRRVVCGHHRKWKYWVHRLVDVVIGDEQTGECYRVFRCWECAERILVRPLLRSHIYVDPGYPMELRGLPLIDDLVNDLFDPHKAHARAVLERRWAWGLGAHELEVSLRAGAAAVELALEQELPDPTYTPPSPRPDTTCEHDQRGVLAAFRAWVDRPDAEHLDRLEALFDTAVDDRGVDTAWVDLLVEAAQSRMERPHESGALARRAIHRACMWTDESIVLDRVRTAVVPWALGAAPLT